MRTGATTAIQCPGCEDHGAVPFWANQSVPVNVGRTAPSEEFARNVRRAAIELCYCANCGLIHNSAFDPAVVAFEPGYQVGLYHSPLFQNFIRSLATRLVEKFDLTDRQVLDIGCGDGYFLKALLRAGASSCVGIDPTCETEGDVSTDGGSLRFVRDFWCAKYLHLIQDFVVCQSVLEDIPRPLEFLRQIRKAIGSRNVPVYFELFNGYEAICRNETWSIHYEQCNYFSLESLGSLFRRAGFEPVSIGTCYEGDQYIFIEAVPSEDHVVEGIPKTVREFAASHVQRATEWTSSIQRWRRAGMCVLIWGSGGKCVSLLNTTEALDVIPCVVDINPDRQGGFIPGAGQEIIPPERVSDISPDVVVISNPLYEREIREQLSALSVHCEVQVL